MRRLLMAMATAILLWTVVQATAGAESPREVVIENFRFGPATLTVPAHTRVRWINRDDAPHKVASSDKKFPASPVLDTGQQYEFTFMQPGTYEYFCSLHPMMTGKVVVR